MVFGASGAAEYVVVTFKGWAGSKKPEKGDAELYGGENFSGALSLGPATVHDDSTGYDLNVEAIFKTDSYTAALSRTNVACADPQ